MAVITLTTDFGTRDGYVAALKGALRAVVSPLDLVDLTHDIEPYDRVAGALFLVRALRHWPASTVHLCVVDPGVGSERPWIAAQFPYGWVVLPDNGLLHYLVHRERPLRLLTLCDAESVRSTFEARDRLAPALKDLLSGTCQLWSEAGSYRRLSIPVPVYDVYRSQGVVLHVDRYGSLITTIEKSALPLYDSALHASRVKVFVGSRLVGRLRATYSEVNKGEPLALFNSDGFLEIACHEGHAGLFYQAHRGQRVELASEVPLRLVQGEVPPPAVTAAPGV